MEKLSSATVIAWVWACSILVHGCDSREEPARVVPGSTSAAASVPPIGASVSSRPSSSAPATVDPFDCDCSKDCACPAGFVCLQAVIPGEVTPWRCKPPN
ncbi:MAG: hypothetical protein JNK04_18395 [Myxococcales bacterium]|nr:hypothetical protein [Myxococcales bacterium]